MATTARLTVWANGDVLTAAALNAEFDNLLTGGINNIQNVNIAADAAIATSKIATTFPAGTIVGTTDSQTLSNKVLTKPTINGSVQAYTSDTDAATITFDMITSNLHNVTLGGNRTLAVNNVASGQAFVIILKQDGTGSRTVTWWSGIKWVNATTPTLTTTAGRWDIFAFIYDGTNYYGSVVGQNFG